MRNWLNNIFILSVCALVFMSCEKDEVRAVLQTGEAPTLSVSETDIVLTEETAEEAAARFTWTAADYGYQAAVQYLLEFDRAGNDFADARTINMTNQLDSTLTVGRLNTIAAQLGLEPEVVQELEVRVQARVYDPAGASPAVEPMYSNTLSLNVTPYPDVVELPSIYVPGAYQGWDPETAAALTSAEDNGVYRGYVTFPDEESLAFKFTTERNWDVNYGEEDGVLVVDGPDLTVPEPGTYLIEADLNEMTWSATPYAWGIIGDATPGGWDEDSDTEMAYDHQNGVWTVTTDLTEGNLKFRLNKDWGTNYGDDDTTDNTLDAGGENIPIPEVGTYTITLDLIDEENPTYSIEPAD